MMSSPSLGVFLNKASVKFPCPNKIDRFVHNDGDRKTEVLSLSLRYYDDAILCRSVKKIHYV